MRAWLELAAAAALSLSGQASAQQPQAPQPGQVRPAALAAGAAACRGLPSDLSAAAALLVQRGWAQTQMTARDGTHPPLFGRDNVTIMLMASTLNGQAYSVCNILGGLPANVTMTELVTAINGAVGSPPRETQNNDAAWDLGAQGAILLTLLPGPPPTANIYVMPRAMAAQ